MRLGLGVWLASGLFCVSAWAGSTTIHGNADGLPKPDYNKTVDMKSFHGFDRNLEFRMLELEASSLPLFTGNLKNLPLTEWTGAKVSLYSKTISPRELEINRAIEHWSRLYPATETSPVLQTESPLAGKVADVPNDTIKTPQLSPGAILEAERLRALASQGAETGEVTVGSGFNKIRLTPLFKEPPGTKSPPKSAPSR